MMIAASMGGKIISIGRLKVLDIAAMVGIVGVSLTLFLNIYAILAGRILYGFATGLIAVSWPRYMEECLPASHISFFGALYCFSFALATIIGFILALGLPEDTDIDGQEKDHFWRVIFGLPIVMFSCQLLFMHTMVKYEPPKYLLILI